MTTLVASVPIVAKYLKSYKQFPPSRRPASFTIDQAIEKLKQGFSKWVRSVNRATELEGLMVTFQPGPNYPARKHGRKRRTPPSNI